MYEGTIVQRPLQDRYYRGKKKQTESGTTVFHGPVVFVKWSLLMKLRKYTMKKLMLEYSEVKDNLFPKSEELDENEEI